MNCKQLTWRKKKKKKLQKVEKQRECLGAVLSLHTPVFVQVSDGPVADVVAVHAAWEADGRHAPIGRLQSRLQGRPHRGDSQDPPAAGHHGSVLQGGAGVENLQPHVLNLRQT